jgi:acetolactate synthase-1/2/3 large subunit
MSPITESTCAEAIAQALHSAGVRHVFGHPGGEVLDLIHALTVQGIEFVLTRHESAAAFMAGTVGRLTGRPGICLATLGPGACNLVLGVSAALLDRDPLVALSARAPADRAAVSGKQHLALHDVFTPVTKWTAKLEGENVGEAVCCALAMAEAPPRGPVYLSFADDWQSSSSATPPPVTVRRAEPDLAPLLRGLNSARWPVAVVGVALDARRDRNSVRQFFAETRIPYVVCPQAKGVADESAPGFLGAAGCGAGDRSLLEVLAKSDCLLGIGFDPVESSQDWHLRAPVYSLSNSPTRLDKYYPESDCIGDVGNLLDQVRLGYRGCLEWRQEDIQETRRLTQELLCPACDGSSAGLSPFHVVQTMRRVLPEDTIASTDVGAHKMLLVQTWRAPEPGTFLTSNGLSAMGYGVPAALAAALTHPDRPVVGFTGDGGMAMMVQELETARRLGLKPLIVVFCDHSLAVIGIAQRVRGLPRVGVDFHPVDWAKAAEGFGARGETPQNLSALEEAVGRWLHRPELTVLAVPVDPDLYVGLSY